MHDLRLFKDSRTRLAPWVKCLADKGYQGIKKVHAHSQTPTKKPPKGLLNDEQKRANRELARERIVVEHVNRRLKVLWLRHGQLSDSGWALSQSSSSLWFASKPDGGDLQFRAYSPCFGMIHARGLLNTIL